jgi:L-lactate dehydrogenase (cytochrome)
LEGGGEDEVTLRQNRAAFDDVELAPRALRDVSNVDTSTTVLGVQIPAPAVLAPVGGPRLFHHEGELAVARAADKARLPYAVSTLSTSTLEEIAGESTGPLWFQLYVWGDRQTTRQLIERAKTAGYTALVLTVDCAVRSKRERELRAGLTVPTPALTPTSILEGALDPAWWWHFLTTEPITFANLVSDADRSGSLDTVESMFDGSLVWDDLAWIRAAWDGPLVLKGIVSPDDARAAVDHGVQAVVVSNHGGRQLDHAPAALDALPDVLAAVGDQIEVLFDSECAAAPTSSPPWPSAPERCSSACPSLRPRGRWGAGCETRPRHPHARVLHGHGTQRRIHDRRTRTGPVSGRAPAVACRSSGKAFAVGRCG